MVKLDDASFFEAIQTADWDAQPLRRYERPEEYPVEKLPPIILNAVREVQEFVQAPMAMIAGCALTAVSAAVQTRFSVRRNEVLVGPPGLYCMTVAESGERKSTVDGLFTKPIEDWEREQERKAKAQQKEYEAELQAWQKCSDPDPDDKPSPPDPVPRVLRGDDTPEALAIALSEYPVAAVISAEAGTIFGSQTCAMPRRPLAWALEPGFAASRVRRCSNPRRRCSGPLEAPRCPKRGHCPTQLCHSSAHRPANVEYGALAGSRTDATSCSIITLSPFCLLNSLLIAYRNSK